MTRPYSAAMDTARSLRASATVLVLLAWGAVLRGLLFTEVSPRPELDLEAGGSFAVNLVVTLPGFVITLLLLGLLPTAVFARHVGAVAAAMAAGLTLLFGAWVLTQDALLAYRPGLAGHLWFDLGASALALAVAAMAAGETRAADRREATEVAV